MTVAVDINPFWDSLTGVGWYLHQILDNLKDAEGLCLRLYGPTVFPDPNDPGPVVELPKGIALVRVAYDIPRGMWIPQSLLIRILRRIEPFLLAIQRSQVLFAPNFVLPSKFRYCQGRLVVTVHDLAFRHFPWTLEEETLQALETQLQRNLSRAAEIITVSAAVRTELLAAEPLDPDHVTAIHHGPGHLASQAVGRVPEGIPARFMLHVGTIEPRKNLELLLRVWEAWARKQPDLPTLVLCGHRGWKSDDLHRAFENAEAAGWLRHPGYVEDSALAALYSKALAVVCPSLYEGFGLPLVEAMSAGTPVVCSDIAVFREVAGASAEFLPADDPEAWLAVLEGLASSQVQTEAMGRDGLDRAAQFDWQRTAAATREVLSRAAD